MTSSAWAAYARPLALLAGVNTSLPAVMSAAQTYWPPVTATLLLFRLPSPVSVLIFTANLLSFPTRRSSDLPNSDALKVWAVSSSVVTVVSVPDGASLTDVTLMVRMLEIGRASCRERVELSASCAWMEKAAYARPLALLAGVNTSLPAVMSAAETYWPPVTATLLLVRLPAPGSVRISTSISDLSAVVFSSHKPNSDALKVWAVSSSVVTVVSVPDGASLTDVTLMVRML